MKRYPSIITASLMLAALTPLQSRAAENTWNNGSTDSFWNLSSANWTSPTIWSDGDSAIFGATGAGAVVLGEAVTVGDQTFNAAGYDILGYGYPLTLAGTSPTITVNADATNTASLYGTNGLTIQGTGVLTLEGDTAVFDGNHYTGGTYVKSGTVILASSGVQDGISYAVDSIVGLDAGAKVVLPAVWDGSSASFAYPQGQIGYMLPGSKFVMTGGTLDYYNDPKFQRIPAPEGTGLIVNTGPNTQAGVQAYIGSTNVEFSGVIADGNGGVLATNNNYLSGPGYQIGIVQLYGLNGGGGTWILSGSNTYSGSTRVQAGLNSGIRLEGNGTIGFPSPIGLTGPMRLYDGFFDLNGHNQTMALLQSGNAAARIFNSATGTVSTLTIGYGNELANRTCSYQLMDNEGTGGIFALKKIITAPYLHWTGVEVTNCNQTLTGVCTYSGDTTVEGGSLILAAAESASPNSAYRLSTNNYALLALTYGGDAPVRQLWINGVQQPNGTYGYETPGIDPASTGTITVTGFAPATLGATHTGNNLNFSWEGVYKLQVSVNGVTGPWMDVAGGGTSPVSIAINLENTSAFYRLVTY
jgi:autotransporter-associated beta strand protein